MDFTQLHNNVKSVYDNFDNIIVEVISKHEAELIDLNTGQLELGIAVDGLQIEPEYAYDEYAKFKKSIGAKPAKGIPDLKVTGDFYSGFRTKKIVPEYIEIDSTDPKAKGLENHYPDQLYGLTNENKGNYAEIIKEPLKDKIYDQFTS